MYLCVHRVLMSICKWSVMDANISIFLCSSVPRPLNNASNAIYYDIFWRISLESCRLITFSCSISSLVGYDSYYYRENRGIPKGWGIYWTWTLRVRCGSIKIYYNAINANYYDVSVTFCDEKKTLAPRSLNAFLLCMSVATVGGNADSWIMSSAEMVYFFLATQSLPGFDFDFRLLTARKWNVNIAWSYLDFISGRKKPRFHSHVPFTEYHL